MTDRLSHFIKDQQLPKSFEATVAEYYVPLAYWLHRQRNADIGLQSGATVVGINGAQGTGKSTLAMVLKIILEDRHDCRVAIFSLDDIYLGRAHRHTLAQTVHPLLQTRGVPGTHDTSLGIDLISRLKNLKPGQPVELPRFDKTQDDRRPIGEWETFVGPADLIIFEGWCVGSTPMAADELADPVNELETREDQDGKWRHYLNEQLQTGYRNLFAQLDLLLMLKAPDFDSVLRWRFEQELKLASIMSDTAKNKLMDRQTLIRFIQHYQRLTQHNNIEMPDRADVVLTLNRQHNVIEAHYKSQQDKHG